MCGHSLTNVIDMHDRVFMPSQGIAAASILLCVAREKLLCVRMPREVCAHQNESQFYSACNLFLARRRVTVDRRSRVSEDMTLLGVSSTIWSIYEN